MTMTKLKLITSRFGLMICQNQVTYGIPSKKVGVRVAFKAKSFHPNSQQLPRTSSNVPPGVKRTRGFEKLLANARTSYNFHQKITFTVKRIDTQTLFVLPFKFVFRVITTVPVCGQGIAENKRSTIRHWPV